MTTVDRSDAPAPSAAEQATIARFGIFDAEERVERAQLTAALRDVLAYCDQIDRSTFMPGLADTDSIRARIEAALGGEQ